MKNAFLIISLSSIALGAELTVTTAVDQLDTPSGAELSLREAIREADSNDCILFDSSLDGSTLTLTQPLEYTKDIEIDASALPNGFAISGNGTESIIFVGSPREDVTVCFRNLDLIDGFVGSRDMVGGAGLRVIHEAKVEFLDGSIRQCQSERNGGAIYIGPDSSLTLDCSTLSNNSTDLDGAAIYLDLNAEFQVTGSTFNNNEAVNRGGAIFANEGVTGTLLRSTVSTNTAGTQGGGIYTFKAPLLINHCTIANNRCDTLGGGISISGDLPITMGHTIVAANRNTAGPKNIDSFVEAGMPTSLSYNLVDDTSFTTAIRNDLTNKQAFLAPLNDNFGPTRTHALLAASHALNNGDPNITIRRGRDQRGLSLADRMNRVEGGRIDIGAFELNEGILVETESDTIEGPQTSLRDALAEVEDGGLIRFDSSLNGQTINLEATLGALTSSNKIFQLDATDLVDGITISGDNQTSCLSIEGGSVSLHAINFTRGIADSAGGGISLSSQGNLLMTNGAIYECEAVNGAGLAVSNASRARLQNVTISGNTASGSGGGISLRGMKSNLQLQHCAIHQNQITNNTLTNAAGIDLNNALCSSFATIFGSNQNSDGVIINAAAEIRLGLQFTSLGYNMNAGMAPGAAAVFDQESDILATDPELSELEKIGWCMLHRYNTQTSPPVDAGPPSPDLLPSRSASGGLRLVENIDIGPHENSSYTGTDTDMDEIPDFWEERWGFDPMDSSDAAEDRDGDGESQLVEYQNGTLPGRFINIVPIDPEFVGIRVLDSAEFGNQIVVEFSTTPGFEYIVTSYSDLGVPSSQLAEYPQTASAGISSVSIPREIEKQFFFVRLVD